MPTPPTVMKWGVSEYRGEDFADARARLLEDLLGFLMGEIDDSENDLHEVVVTRLGEPDRRFNFEFRVEDDHRAGLRLSIRLVPETVRPAPPVVGPVDRVAFDADHERDVANELRALEAEERADEEQLREWDQ